MPHSPRMFDGELYLLLSATGELVTVDPDAGTWEVVNRLPGFVRGMARWGDYLFVGSSHLRQSHTFGDLPLASTETMCGIVIVHLGTGSVVGNIRYVNSCEEIYDVQVLPGLRRPSILGTRDGVFRQALMMPEASYWGQADKPDRQAP